MTIPNSVTSIGGSVFSGCSALTSVTIGNSVTNIGNYAFRECSELTSITIPNSVTSIGDYAFYNCSKLTNVTIGNNVTSIASSAFYNCSGLMSVTLNSHTIVSKTYTSDKNIKSIFGAQVTEYIIGGDVTSIGNYAFYNCSALTGVTIGNSVTDIGNYVFYKCSGLTSVTIGNNVTSIGDWAFSGCSSLTSPVYNTHVFAYLPTSYSGAYSIPDDIELIAGGAFYNCSALTSVTIGNSVSNIGNYVFYKCSGLTSVTIGNSVTNIGNYAFRECSELTSITIPNSVTSIGGYAFQDCSKLTSVTIPDSVISIENYTFYNCSALTSITIPDNVTSVGSYAFAGCSALTSITIPNNVTSIGSYAFAVCSALTSVTIPNSVTSIGDYAFSGCSVLKDITLNSNSIVSKTYTSDKNIKSIFGAQVKKFIIGGDVTSIGNYAFYNCSKLTSVTIPNSVKTIGDHTFYNCSALTSVTIPNSVKTIGDHAFYNCSALTSVTVGNGVTSIGVNAFQNCSALTSVHISDIAAWCAISFSGSLSNPLLYAKHLYVNDTEIIDLVIPDSVTGIGNYAFHNCSALTSVTIPNSVTSIGGSVFSGCSGLTSVTIPNSVTSIGGSAFSECSTLIRVTIPNGVTSIGNYTFYNCSALTSVTIPNSVTSIGDYAFNNCSKLTSVTMGNNVTCIGGSAFLYCSKLKSVTIPSSVTSIGDNAFSMCSRLKNVTLNSNSIVSKTYTSDKNIKSIFGTQVTEYIIGGDVTSIGDYAFNNCSKLTSVTIGNNVTSIGDYAFQNCSALTSVHISDIAAWCAISFSGSLSNPLFYAKHLYVNDTEIIVLVIPNIVRSIGNYAFYNCSALTSVIIPDSVTSIGDSAFYGCTSNRVVINNSALDIVKGATNHGYVAYYASDVYFGSDRIDDFLFSNRENKDYVVAYLGNDCQITLPANYHGNSYSIGAHLFRNNSTVNSITIPNSVTSIGDYAFNGCSNLNVMYIGNSVISIGKEAFYNCPLLYKIIMLPNSVPSGINDAFESLTGRITYVGNTNYQSGYNVLGTRRIYSNLNSYFSVNGIVYALVNPSQRICDIIDCDYSGATTEFTIGNSVEYRNITLSVDSININSFRNNTKLTKLVIDCNHAIPSCMASNCSNLDTLLISSNVRNIGENAFNGCSKESNAYYYINNDGNISSSAFAECDKLYKLVITDYVKNIETQAFYSCDGIVDADIYNNGGIASKAFQNSSTIGNATYHLHNRGVVEDYAFANCTAIKTLVIDECVRNIGQHAFQECTGLTNVTIKNNGMIGASAFNSSSTRNAATYVINNVGLIGESAFANCTAIKNLTVDSTVTTIGQYAFQECTGLTNVTIKNNGMIGVSAFNGSSTESAATYVINNVGLIGESAFANCTAIKNLTVDSTVTTIGQYAFQECTGLTNVTIKNNGMIGVSAFNGSSTESAATYVINNVGLIGESAFANCSKLQKVRFGNQVGNINQRAFYDCVLLDSVALPNSVNALGDSVFFNCNKLVFAQLSNALTSIGDAAFDRCNSLPKIFIPKSVSSIGQGVFRKCSSLSIVGFEKGLNSLSLGRDSVNKGLFYDCPLDSVYIGRELTYQKAEAYGYSPFYRSPTLRSIVISDVPSKVETNEFYGCTNLSYVLIGNGVRSIGDYAFSGCSSINYFSFGDQVKTIGAEAFSDCVAMTQLYSYCHQPPTCGASALADIDKWNCTLYIPKGTTDVYTAADQWKDFFFIEESANIQYTISVNFDSSKGYVTGAGVYDKGDEAVLTATPFEGCIFVKWEDGSTDPERHITVYQSATYTAVFNTAFTITFKNGDEILQSTQVEYGTMPTCNEPSKPATAQYTYIFKGWTPEVVAVTSDAVYTAEFDSVVNQYTITFNNYDGTELQSGKLDYGTIPIYEGDTPKHFATAQYTYSFKGWKPEIATVIGDAVYTAEYDSIVNQYTVLFVNYDGTELQSDKLDYGTMPAYNGTTPMKPANTQYAYRFKGWKPEIVAVTDNAVYTADFDSIVNQYTITFKDEDGSVLCSEQWNYGTMPSCEEPTKAKNEHYTYSFSGWNPSVVAVSADAEYWATYTATPKPTTSITSVDNNEQVSTKVMRNGQLFILRGDEIYNAQGARVK